MVPGKTRLALRVAADMVDEFEDGVFFVPLAALSDPALVLPTIAQTFDVREAAGRSLQEQLQDYLQQKQMLLILDNFEQVIDAAPRITDLLTAAPRLKVLVTSREVLRLSGETDYPVPPLSLPDPKRLPPLELLTQYEAVALFVERALAVKSAFAITDENAPAVAEICYRLDGLPLAIELAAAHTRVLPPQRMLAELSHRFNFLVGGARDLPARQKTLRGTIDWSHALLTGDEQQLFRRLGVFVGGCALEAIEAVCNIENDLSVLEALESLVGKSLLKQTEAQGEPRFAMLETIREYARDRLIAAGEDERVRERHRDYFLALAEEAEPKLMGAEQAAWLQRLEEEHENLRAALDWSFVAAGSGGGLRLCGALQRFWSTRGHFSEGREWCVRALAKAERGANVRAREGAQCGGRPGPVSGRLSCRPGAGRGEPGDPAAIGRPERHGQLARQSSECGHQAGRICFRPGAVRGEPGYPAGTRRPDWHRQLAEPTWGSWRALRAILYLPRRCTRRASRSCGNWGTGRHRRLVKRARDCRLEQAHCRCGHRRFDRCARRHQPIQSGARRGLKRESREARCSISPERLRL